MAQELHHGQMVSADNDWNLSGNNIYNANSGNVGINTSSPNAALEVRGGFIPGATSQEDVKSTTKEREHLESR